MKRADTQCENILDHLRKGYALSPLGALEAFGCFRLAARINDLRADGHLISMDRETHGGKTFAVYRLTKEKLQ